MARRICLDCPAIAPPGRDRCDTCRLRQQRAAGSATQRGYNAAWARHAKATIAAYRTRHGDICPGWQRDPHPITASEWVCDHDLGPLCRSCNAVKAATTDRARAKARAASQAQPER